MSDELTIGIVTDRVRRLIVAADLKAELDGEHGFALPFEDHVCVFVHVDEQRSDDGDYVRFPVECWAWVIGDVEVTPDLIDHLAFRPGYTWGHLSAMREDGGTATLVFRHVLLGDYLDEKELINAIYTVAGTASDLIDELHPRFGGRRFGEG